MPMKFEVTAQHLALLRRMRVCWNGGDDHGYPGAPTADPNWPYVRRSRETGDAPFVERDIAQILGVALDRVSSDADAVLSERGDRQADKLLRFHEQMDVVLQIVLFTGEFRAGKFYRPNRRDIRTWMRQESA